MNSWFNGEQSTNQTSVYGSITANRITDDWKIRLSLNEDYSESYYDYEDTKLTSVYRSYSAYGQAVRSLDSHWSAALSGEVESSTYNNIEVAIGISPAIEYNIFPYSESTRRELRLSYYLNATSVRYVDTTIYEKTEELLFNHSLGMSLNVTEPWGSVGISLRGRQYLHDLTKRNVSISGNLSLKLFEGLSINIFGGYSRINDQLALPKAGATPDEVLLRRKELETSYSYWGSFGISYTFGSIYNNIVNPRFGTGGGRTFSISF